jgi:hypothetical protein
MFWKKDHLKSTAISNAPVVGVVHLRPQHTDTDVLASVWSAFKEREPQVALIPPDIDEIIRDYDNAKDEALKTVYDRFKDRRPWAALTRTSIGIIIDDYEESRRKHRDGDDL